MRNNLTSHILTQYPTQHATGADLCEISTPREMRSDATRRGRRGYFARRAAERRRATCQIRSRGNAPLSAKSARRTFRFPFGNGGHSSLSGSRVQVQRCDFKFKVGMGNIFQEITTISVGITQATRTVSTATAARRSSASAPAPASPCSTSSSIPARRHASREKAFPQGQKRGSFARESTMPPIRLRSFQIRSCSSRRKRRRLSSRRLHAASTRFAMYTISCAHTFG